MAQIGDGFGFLLHGTCGPNTHVPRLDCPGFGVASAWHNPFSFSLRVLFSIQGLVELPGEKGSLELRRNPIRLCAQETDADLGSLVVGFGPLPWVCLSLLRGCIHVAAAAFGSFWEWCGEETQGLRDGGKAAASPYQTLVRFPLSSHLAHATPSEMCMRHASILTWWFRAAAPPI